MGSGPLTRTELTIAFVAVVVLALIITSTLLRASRHGNAQSETTRLQQPIPAFAPPQATGIGTTSSMGTVTGLPATLPGGLSNSTGDASVFSGLTNSPPVDWLRSLETGPTQNTGP